MLGLYIVHRQLYYTVQMLNIFEHCENKLKRVNRQYIKRRFRKKSCESARRTLFCRPPCRSASGGGACPCRSCFACRIIAFSPPSPRPALAERSSRREGGTLGYFMQGASPLASPRLDGARHWLSLPYRCLDGRRNHSQGTLFVGFAETYRFSRRGAGGEAPGKIN